jgi:AmmeMemoRadiSam system protein B
MTGASFTVRPPAVAGLFYPSSPDDVRHSVRDAFESAVHPEPGAPVPEAIIVPHAGYIYSGAIAASAYERIVPARRVIRRVVLLGPSHRFPVRGLAVPSVDAFDTPLGRVPVDAAARALALELPAVVIEDRAHAAEHSLEVQLPFLQSVLDDFTVLPISVGDASAEEVASVLDACWGGPETLVVISTDLSHYHAYDEAVALDARTAAAIVGCRPEALDDHDACGARPVRGLLRCAAHRGLTVEQLDLRNSGDTAGGRDRVVGYGAFTVGHDDRPGRR